MNELKREIDIFGKRMMNFIDEFNKNILIPITTILSKIDFYKLVKDASEFNERLYNIEHIKNISKYGWTMNYFVARISELTDYGVFDEDIYYEYIRNDTFYKIDAILEILQEDYSGNNGLYREIKSNIERKNFTICLPSLVTLVEREVRVMSNEFNHRKRGVLSYFKKEYDNDNNKVREYSIYLFLNDKFFNSVNFNRVKYDESINRNVMQHGMYETDYLGEFQVYQLLNVLITLAEIKMLNKGEK